MQSSLDKPISVKKEFIINPERKKGDAEYEGKTLALMRPEGKYYQDEAFQ